MEKKQTNPEKQAIRAQMYAARRQADPQVLLRDSERIAEKLFALPQFEEASCIYVYLDYNREVATGLILREAERRGKRTAAPRVSGENMDFYYLRSEKEAAPGFHGIPEPVPARGEQPAEEEDALLLVPGVAFDGDRHRIGYGKGFYDRYLSAHTRHTTVALAFDFQIVERIPADPQDIVPQILLTPNREYRGI